MVWNPGFSLINAPIDIFTVPNCVFIDDFSNSHLMLASRMKRSWCALGSRVLMLFSALRDFDIWACFTNVKLLPLGRYCERIMPGEIFFDKTFNGSGLYFRIHVNLATLINTLVPGSTSCDITEATGRLSCNERFAPSSRRWSPSSSLTP